MARAPVTATAYRVTFLSPVHVGTEERLGQHDVVFLGGRLHRVAADRLLRELEREPQTRDRYLTGGLPQIAAWLQQADRLRRLALYGSPVPREPQTEERTSAPSWPTPSAGPTCPARRSRGPYGPRSCGTSWPVRRPDRARLARTVGRRRNRRGEEEDERDRRHVLASGSSRPCWGPSPGKTPSACSGSADSEPRPAAAALRVYPVLVARPPARRAAPHGAPADRPDAPELVHRPRRPRGGQLLRVPGLQRAAQVTRRARPVTCSGSGTATLSFLERGGPRPATPSAATWRRASTRGGNGAGAPRRQACNPWPRS
jgi:hypothetical protein